MASLLGSSGAATKSGSGLGYGGSNSSSISTPVNTTAGGGVGPQNFNLGSLGIGNTQGVPTWVWIAAAALVAFWLFKRK